MEISQKIFEMLPDFGADFIELGMPFSDPMADGPAIQSSSLRALNHGMNLKKTLLMVRNFRKKNLGTPVILMGYYNPIYQHGVERFIKDSQNFGVDGFIIVDMPPEEDKEFVTYLKNTNMDLVKLLTPLIQLLLTDWFGPPTTLKPSNEGGLKLSPSLFILKSTLKFSLTPKLFLLTSASNLI